MQQATIAKSFLFILIIGILYACYKIFEPFLIILIVATVLVTIFYTPYEQLVKLLRGHKSIAAFIMCILVSLLVIVPLTNFLVYTAQRSVEAYDKTLVFINEKDIPEIVESQFWQKYNFIGLDSDAIRSTLLDVAKKVNEWLVNGAGAFLKGTTNFVFSLIMIIFTMFFFFVDGSKMLEKLMYWTPLPNKYDRELFKKFKDVSSSTILSTFVTAIAQGLIGALGFMIVGVPAFFAGIAMALLALLPYIGAALVWFPVGVYLLIVGKIWQGIFLLIWGAGVVSVVDNVLKAYIIKDKAQVHPIFIIFSILGGISLFGFWGVVFGPLIISLAVTILHIYELEYGDVLEK
jgi:predicted PurR-regulated permease PerM